MKRQSVKETVFYKDGVYGSVMKDNKYTPDKLGRIVEWLGKLLESIPAEYRDSARFDVDSVGGYEGEHHAEITIFYERPATDEEMASRIADEERRQRQQEDAERRTLAALQAKYASTNR